MNRLAWYNTKILSTHILGMANRAVSLFGIVTNLNSKESNRIKFSANTLTFFIEDLLLGNLFWERKDIGL